MDRPQQPLWTSTQSLRTYKQEQSQAKPTSDPPQPSQFRIDPPTYGMGLTIQTQPTVEPLSVAEAKNHLRLEIPDDDVLVGSLITTARRYCENFTNRAFITQTWKLTLDDFPCGGNGTVGYQYIAYAGPPCIQIPKPKLQSVSSLKYYDTDGTLQTWDAANYVVDNQGEPGRVCVAPTKTGWPVTQTDRINAVEVTFVCGYGDADDVPKDLKAAMLLLLAHLYENREATSAVALNETPMAVESILRQYGWGAYR